jgi:hypothetical protein
MTFTYTLLETSVDETAETQSILSQPSTEQASEQKKEKSEQPRLVCRWVMEDGRLVSRWVEVKL